MDLFLTAGSSPPSKLPTAVRLASPSCSIRYRLKLATWTVVREPDASFPRVLDQPAAVADLARELIPDDDREHFLAFHLDSQNRLRFVHRVSTGTQTATLVSPRDVLGPALREGSVAVILAHSHPSGDPTPSRDDIALTRRLKQGAELVDLKIHDHVVIGMGTGAWVSMAERGLLS